jgi:ribonuclease Z
LLRSGAGFRRLGRILLTHGHFDHYSARCLSTLRLRRSDDLMTMHASPSTLQKLDQM